MKTATIFLPALDEEKHIGKVIEEIPLGEIKKSGFTPMILVVNGPSKDKTGQIAKKKGAAVIQTKRGKGNAVKDAFKHIKTDFAVMLDADETYPCRHIIEMLEALEKGNDIVMGSRFKGKIRKGAMGKAKVFGNKIITLCGNLLYGARASDICTGYWGFSKNAIKKIKISAEGFDIEANLFAQAKKKKMLIAEIPIEYRDRQDKGHLRALNDGAIIIMRLLRERFSD